MASVGLRPVQTRLIGMSGKNGGACMKMRLVIVCLIKEDAESAQLVPTGSFKYNMMDETPTHLAGDRFNSA